MTEQVRANVRDAVEAFAFLIRGMGRVSGKDFADMIRKDYSMGNAQNAECERLIRENVAWVELGYNEKGQFKRV